MSRRVTLPALLVAVQVLTLAGGVAAQDISTVPNATNPCIDSTYRLWSPNMASPTFILIDRRVNINPVTVCTSAGQNSANCNRDSGSPMLLVASASGNQIMNNPFCSWSCGPTCGTIVTDGSDGLPVELMDFGVEDEEPHGDEGDEGR